ncbi:MAG: glycosyltransferase family 4 protein [Gemmatimonadaceae bacterium]
MRIALLIELAPRKLGSLENWIVAFAAEARHRGHQVDVFGREPVHADVARALRDMGAGWDTLDTLMRHPVAAARRLARGYDVLHLDLFPFTPRDPIVRIALAAWPARVLFVDHNSGVDVFDAAPSAPLPGWRRVARRWLGQLTALRVAGIAGVSDYVRRREGERFGLGSPFVRTIYNGVDVARFARASPAGDAHAHAEREAVDGRHHAGGRGIRIAAVAYLIPGKGIDVLLRAVADAGLANATVVIAGEGPEEPRLRALAASLGIAPRVEFVGVRDDVDAVLHSADIFVHPARYDEAFGLVVTEAMAAGCTVIASRVGGIPELIVDGESGVLVPPGDAGALAAALARVAADPALRRSLSANARRRVVTRFALDDSVRRHVDWCEEVR